MSRSVLRLLAGPRFGALLAFLTAGILLPSAARAACSSTNHLKARSPAADTAIGVDLLRSVGAFSGAEQEVPGRRPAPCSGAFCSGNPAPLQSPIPTITTTVQDWALPGSRIILQDLRSYPFSAADEIRRPDERSRSIFHPPPA